MGAYHLHGQTGNSGLKLSQMVRVIPFGTFCKLWATGWFDTLFVLSFSVFLVNLMVHYFGAILAILIPV